MSEKIDNNEFGLYVAGIEPIVAQETIWKDKPVENKRVSILDAMRVIMGWMYCEEYKTKRKVQVHMGENLMTELHKNIKEELENWRLEQVGGVTGYKSTNLDTALGSVIITEGDSSIFKIEKL